jgi:hypothetical protein
MSLRLFRDNIIIPLLYKKCASISQFSCTKFTFDVSKCDKLFHVLGQGGVIKLTKGHDIPTPENLTRKKYCKWHDSYSHMTNDCNYFYRQVQSALNDD